MELNDSFEVAHPIDKVWGVLTDVERVAPCLPGAQLTGSDGNVHEGFIKVKLGPITSQYKGTATFAERDDTAHKLVLSASGRDTRGAGNASAQITVALEALSESSTKVNVETDLTITGKVAQFGRGVLADVSRKLMGQFADNLAELVATDASDAEQTDQAETAENADNAERVENADAATSEEADAPAASTPPKEAAPIKEVEAVDILSVAGAPMMKRLIPAIIVLAVVIVVVVLIVAA